jgi:hypothetical protein
LLDSREIVIDEQNPKVTSVTAVDPATAIQKACVPAAHPWSS